MPDDTTEGLRERLKAAFDNFTCEHSRSECADCLADTAVAALSRMVDPVDLPARMAEAAKDAFCGGDNLPDGTRLLSDLRSPWRALDDALAAALSVRWEAAVQASAAADELRRQLADAEAELQGRTERAWQAQRERDEARRELADVHHDLTLTVGDAYTSARSAAVEVMRQLAAAEAEVERLRAELAEARAKHQTEIASLQRLADRFRQQDDDRHARLLTERDALKAAIERVRAQGTFWSVCAAETVAAFGRGVLAALDAPETPEERNA